MQRVEPQPEFFWQWSDSLLYTAEAGADHHGSVSGSLSVGKRFTDMDTDWRISSQCEVEHGDQTDS